MAEGGLEAVRADDAVVAASRVREFEAKIRDLERLLSRKTMEVRILRETLDAARGKKPGLRLPSPPPSLIRFAAQPRWKRWPKLWASLDQTWSSS